MLCVAVQLRKSPELIARELCKLAATRQLDTESYADSVKKKKIRRAAPTAPCDLAALLKAEQAAHKSSNRKNKRRISKLCSQLTGLRKKCRGLQSENQRLKRTINELLQGTHDLTLNGNSQEDMEDLMRECGKSPMLEAELIAQDDGVGTLQSFWSEQVSRSTSSDKRKRWNPIVLRFMLHLWEKMGEKSFRVFGDEKVRGYVLSERTHSLTCMYVFVFYVDTPSAI